MDDRDELLACKLEELPFYCATRRVLIVIRKLSRCSLVDSEYLRHKQKLKSKPTLKPARDDEEVSRTISKTYYESAVRFGFWSNALILAYILSSIHFSFYVYHQYMLDWNLVRLDFLMFVRGSPYSRNKEIPAQLVQRLNETIERENRLLDWLGGPLKQMTFVAELFYCLEFLYPLFGYFLTQVIFSFYLPFDQYILRILIDYRRELKLCRRLINEQVDEFLASHRMYTRTITITLADHEDKWCLKEALKDVQQSLVDRHWFIEQELEVMRSKDDRLLPANRSLDWITKWLRPYLATAALSFLSGLLYIFVLVALVYFLPLLRPHEPQPWLSYGLTDWLVILETVIFLFALDCSVVLYGATLTFSALDQMWLASKLSDAHEQFLFRSKRELSSHRREYISLGGQLNGGMVPKDSLRYRLNCELLELLMKFKIFAKQLVRPRHLYGANAFSLLSAFFLVPVVSRIHAPYFDPNLLGSKAFLVILSVLTLVPVSYSVLVPCKMFCRCLRLHKQRLKLLAHIVGVEQVHPNLFNGHLTMRLRRETSSYYRLADEFAFGLFGFNFTYANLIKLYFWFGALILSAMFRPSTIVARLEPQTGRLKRHYSMLSAESLLDDPFKILGDV